MASQIYEIPLTAEPQRFDVILNGVEYYFVLTWCKPQQYWLIEIQDRLGKRLVGGIPLITGADLLAQYQYLGIGGALIVQTDTDALAVPTYTNLGQTARLYFLTNG